MCPFTERDVAQYIVLPLYNKYCVKLLKPNMLSDVLYPFLNPVYASVNSVIQSA